MYKQAVLQQRIMIAFIMVSANVDFPTLQCDENDVVCDGMCVNKTLQCNNEYDCNNGEDESFQTCGCRHDEFACADRCIPIVERCDLNCTCGNCTDEDGCESFVCLPAYAKCKNHLCIPKIGLCNFIDDCGDNSDEENCNHKDCDGLFHFECDNKQCISHAYVCDGIEDCFDGSDELRCERENFHFCEDGNEVHESRRCNMKADCRSGSDEHGCECDPVQCPAENRCFPHDIRCNNLCECANCSDEEQCGEPCDVTSGLYCPFFDFLIGSYWLSGCVRSERICDGAGDCGTWEDETYCNSHYHNFVLEPCPNPNDKRFIPSFAFCDGQPYCMMGSDEQNCSAEVPTCSPGQFQCADLTCIDDSLLCNGFWNCKDYSDETNCGEYECPDETQFKCNGTGQCLASHQRCNGEVECVYLNGTKDESDEENCVFRECEMDEFRCHSNHCIEGWRRCFKAADDFLYGCKDRSHLWDCASWHCNGSAQFKCPRDYCIPGENRCNIYPDCENHGDEEDCSPACHPDKYPGCICDGKEFKCSHKNITTFDLKQFEDDVMTWMYLSHNHLNSSQLMTGFNSTVAFSLIHLDLSHNDLQDLPAGLFEMMTSLRHLNLGYNSIMKIDNEAFSGLYNLMDLVLTGNIIQYIQDGSFYGLNHLTILDLSYQRLVFWEMSPFLGLRRLRLLNISNNRLETVPASTFFGLTNIHTIDMSNNNVSLIYENTFKGLQYLEKIITDEFRFCCAAKHMPDVECLPKADEFSSCEDLMRNKFLRLNLWIVGLVATLCNAVVIVTRSGKRRDSRVQSFLITNLAIGDMCMGIYLLIIAVADLHFRGNYGIYDSWWRNFILCKFAGFLSTFSSELSVLSLTFITLHRVSSIVFPFRTKDMGFSRIVWIMTSAWVIVFVLAVIPLMGLSYFGNFYGRSGVCLALHITPDKPSGWEYAVFVFLILNFFSFMFIAGAYIVMFYVARRTQQAAKRSLRSNKGSDAMARKMTLIVFTDFCCWMPIIVLGVASLCGAKINPQVFAWIAVFVLPLNSAVNPLLYTLWTTPYARQIINRARETILRSTATTEYKLSANLSTSEKFSSTLNGRRRGNRALPGTSNTKLPPEKSTGSMRSSDVINDPEETIRMNEISHNKGSVYVNPNNNHDGKTGNRDKYEKMMSDKGMEVKEGHSSGEE